MPFVDTHQHASDSKWAITMFPDNMCSVCAPPKLLWKCSVPIGTTKFWLTSCAISIESKEKRLQALRLQIFCWTIQILLSVTVKFINNRRNYKPGPREAEKCKHCAPPHHTPDPKYYKKDPTQVADLLIPALPAHTICGSKLMNYTDH